MVCLPQWSYGSKEGFGTPGIASLFKQLEAEQDDVYGLASPGGFEPPLPP